MYRGCHGRLVTDPNRLEYHSFQMRIREQNSGPVNTIRWSIVGLMLACRL